MSLSFSRSGDEDMLNHIRALQALGANVVFSTTEDNTGSSRTIIRRASIEWMTHNPDAKVL